MGALFHIIDRATWEGLAGATAYRPPSLTTEGFVHLSTGPQWQATANRFFRGRADLVLLELDPARLRGEIRYEAADGDHFPHLYAALDLDAVVAVHVLPVTADGTIGTPETLARSDAAGPG